MRTKGSFNKTHKPPFISFCPQCQIEIIDKHPRTFCSLRCKATYQKEHLTGRNNPNWKEDKFYYTNPHSLQKLIKKRDIYCQKCGSSEHLEVHHKVADHFNNSNDNLILLCKNCHAKEHLQNGQTGIANLILSCRKYHRRPPRNCVICNTEFIPKRDNVTCSRDCQKALWSRNRKGRIPPNKGINRVILTCHTCGKQFERRQGNIKSQLAFCSRPCQIKHFSHS